MSEKKSRDYDNNGSTDVLNRKPSRSFSMKSQKPPDVKLRSLLSKALNHFDRAKEDDIKVKYITEIWKIMDSTWQLPVIGRDLAYEFSDDLRREKIVSFALNRLQLDGGTPAVQRECARLLEQVLTTENRHYVAKYAIEIVTKYTKIREDIDIIRINVGILESLFKDTETTCTRLIDLGGLDTVLHACRHDDLWTARHCAAALANASIFGGSINHKRMVGKGASDWLFPLAFRTDDFCRFYSCLAITVLAANPLVERAVVKSGTLELVEPFVQSHDPYEFAQTNPSHAQGRSAGFLQRMIPLLISGRPEAQALASFYFAMEASIKAKQQKTQIFAEISAIIPLKRVIATSQSSIARVLAGRCLKIIGEDVPRKLSPQIHLWDMDDVQSWLTVAGFRGFQSSFRSSTVDGEMLLLLTERELREDLDMTNNVHRKRFIRDLNRLRMGADYRSIDTTGICDWLKQVDSKFAQYTYRLLQAGVDRPFLPLMTDAHLRDDCGIENGVHRTKILASVEKFGVDGSRDGSPTDHSGLHDVFISYRRNNGSHLASLLKVHLQIRGFRVFLDVESLQEGEFADRTLKSVRSASTGFVLVLTAGALDKCAIDHEGTDWLHKEILTAISNRRNIVPVTTETFQWPLPEDLPKDIAPICFYNGVKWIHEYQDACVDKVERFLRGQDPPASKLSRISSVQSGRDGIGAPPHKRGSTHPNRTVRPSGSTDNLVESERYPRSRQRASPPGQAYNLPGSVSNRGIAGADSESARSLDQGDGASAPFNRGMKPSHYPSSVKSTSTVPGTASSGPTLKADSPGSSSASSSSSKNLTPTSKGIKKDIVKLEEVMAETSERSKESESEGSSDYSSSDESDREWEIKEKKRGGADGKSGRDGKRPDASASSDQTRASPPKKLPKTDTRPDGPSKMHPDMIVRPTTQTSPDGKPKASTKYKAPPPPLAGQPRSLETSSTSDPRSRPDPIPRRGSREFLESEATGGKMATSSQPVPNPNKLPTAEKREEIRKPVKTVTNAVVTPVSHPNPIQKPQRRDLNSGPPRTTQPENSNTAPDKGQALLAPPTDNRLTESDYSDGSSLEEPHRTRESDDPRVDADGNDEGRSSSQSSGMLTPDEPGLKKAAVNRNSNNNNSAGLINGVRDRGNVPPKTGSGAKKASVKLDTHSSGAKTDSELQPSSQGPEHRRSSQSNYSSTRSTPRSLSPHSMSSADAPAQSSSRPPRKNIQGGLSNLVARRDVAPQDGGYAPKRSASERLQTSKPHHPAYPMGGSHFHPSGAQPPPYQSPPMAQGYNMDQYKAAMAAGSGKQPYPGHQPQVYQQGAPMPKTRSIPHGFDTAV